MSQELSIKNAEIVTRDRVFKGSVQIRDGKITDIDQGNLSSSSAMDFEGDMLLPGLIEMHTDNLEKHFQPRPGVNWPAPIAALVAHDAQISSAGITTVFDAVACGEYKANGIRRRLLTETMAALDSAKRRDILRADHRVHLRCEVSDKAVVEMFDEHADNKNVQLISIMDHTPGQRQWRDMDKYRQFNRDKGWTDEEFDLEIKERVESQAIYAEKHLQEILDRWKDSGYPVASHDDTTIEHVEEGLRNGVTISEFPCTLAAAKKAQEFDMAIIMGAPNIVRGQSHSGNVSAMDLAKSDCLDGLSSDYVPASLLHAAFLMHEKAPMKLPDAIAKVSLNLAKMLDLDDRGEIATGKRGDVIRVKKIYGLPVVRQVWREGNRVV